MLLIPILMIGPYSIYKSLLDNTANIEKSTLQTLKQLDNTVESLYSHIDNANIFFASNPRVTIQMKNAFNEKALTLNSLKNIQNLSLYFQNLIYTDPYIQNIYVYYDNENQRIYITQKGAIQSISSPENKELIYSYNNSGNKDFWMIVSHKQDIYTKSPLDSLFVFQKLYTRSTSHSAGVIIFEFSLSKIEQAFHSYMQYKNNIYYLIDSDNQIICTNSSASVSSTEIASLLPELAVSNEQDLFSIKINGTEHIASYLRSKRKNGLTYITFTPSSEIYKTTRNLSRSYIILTICGVIISFVLAFYKTNKEYGYLNNIIDIFSNPTASHKLFKDMPSRVSNPFELIMLNVIRLFLEQDYLKMQASERESKMQMLEMQMLQYQINPHFLHNTLNSIYWEAVRMTSSENSCSTMVSNLSTIMRYSLSTPQEDVKISDEINYLKTYLEIMKIRYPDKFDVKFRIDQSCTIYPIKKMILQPLVENAIYHGIKEKSEKGTICVGTRLLKHSILIYILDDGIGISSSNLTDIKEKLCSNDSISTEHIGLINTNLRLKLSYGKDTTLHIKSMEGKFTYVYFYIPLVDE